MDGIAAIEARVAEICARFAPPPSTAPAAPAPENTFGAHLRKAMGTGNVEAWIAEAIARTGVPASWAPGLRALARGDRWLLTSAPSRVVQVRLFLVDRGNRPKQD